MRPGECLPREDHHLDDPHFRHVRAAAEGAHVDNLVGPRGTLVGDDRLVHQVDPVDADPHVAARGVADPHEAPRAEAAGPRRGSRAAGRDRILVRVVDAYLACPGVGHDGVDKPAAGVAEHPWIAHIDLAAAVERIAVARERLHHVGRGVARRGRVARAEQRTHGVDRLEHRIGASPKYGVVPVERGAWLLDGVPVARVVIQRVGGSAGARGRLR